LVKTRTARKVTSGGKRRRRKKNKNKNKNKN
jgi:hypothetical protein